MKYVGVVLVLMGTMFAGVRPQPVAGIVSVAELQSEKKAEAGPEAKLPDIPDGYQVKFQALVIKQQNIQRQMEQLEQLYKNLQNQLVGINNQGTELEKKMFGEMKLDPKEYHTKVSDSGVLVVIHDPPQKKEEKK